MGTAQFKIKCPWCQVIIQIIVQPKITAELVNAQEPPHHNTNFNSFSPNDLKSDPEEAEEFENYKHPSQANIPQSGMKVVGYLYPEKK